MKILKLVLVGFAVTCFSVIVADNITAQVSKRTSQKTFSDEERRKHIQNARSKILNRNCNYTQIY